MKVFMIVIFFFISLYGENKNISVQLRWKHQFQFAGYYMALHKGFYKRAGFDVTLLEGDSSTNVVDSVLSKKADFGVSNSSLVIDYLSGLDVVMLGAIFQHSPNILLAKEKFKSPIDLAKGGPIALMGGDQDIELKAMFIKEGINLSKIKFVPKQKHLDDLLENKVVAINAYSSNEPYLLSKEKKTFSILEPRAYGLDFYGDTLFTSTALYESDHKVVSDFRQATFKGWEYALENIEETVALIEKNYNTQNKSKEHLLYEASVLRKLINPDFIQIGHSNPGRWEHIVEVYKQFGLIKQTRTLEDFFYKEKEDSDNTWIYFYILISSLIIVIVGGIAYYIYRINKQLSKSEQRHKILFQNSASAGIVWKKGYIITDWNEQATRLFGWSANEVKGRCFLDFLVLESEREMVTKNLKTIANDSNLHIFINQNILKNQTPIVCEWHNTLLQKSKEEDDYEIVSLAIDVTERLKEEEILKTQANNDSLTTLPNRHFFENEIEKIYALTKRKGGAFGLAFIDLDGFKAINDTHGHDAGDVLLKELAKRFQTTIRQEDMIARIGGDEFALIFHISKESEPYEKMIKRILELANTPVQYGKDTTLQVSASIGISFYCQDNQVSIGELVHQADNAMYEAKRKGKNCFYIFENFFQ
ncbi:MAG: diguanylate cyclase [Arcobacteraceae bacterium]|nr:diguanylate cyclase [Arcobacteraceae bacterium]